MKKTLILFGMHNTLVSYNKGISNIWEALAKPKKNYSDFFNQLMQIKKENQNVDYYILSNFDDNFIDKYLDRTDSKDVFNQKISLNYSTNTFFDEFYNSQCYYLFRYMSKPVFMIEDYDKVILIDSNRKQRIDFLRLKLRLLFNRNNPALKKFNNSLWGYIYGTSYERIIKKLKKMIKKEKGIIIN